MSDINSKIEISLKDSLKSSFTYLREVLALNILILLASFIIFQWHLNNIFILFIIVAIINFILLIYIGRKRIIEISKITSIVDKIYRNEISSPDEIKLGENLKELENSFKSMFYKTQNDIENLKKLESARKEFLGNVSHELRTPIFAIQGYLETLQEGAIDDDNVKYNFLNKALRHTKNLNDLLNDLINISMIESGNMLMSFRYFELTGFVEDIVAELQNNAAKKGLILRVLYEKRLEVYGDNKRLKQVFVNLIQNAIKYTDEGYVEVRLEELQEKVRITVKDSGIGIPKEDLSRVFERFYRVDKGRSRAIGGTGLGLAIVKHIVEAHNSQINVKSIVGLGTEFSFELPK